jgi:hypothetical protein
LVLAGSREHEWVAAHARFFHDSVAGGFVWNGIRSPLAACLALIIVAFVLVAFGSTKLNCDARWSWLSLVSVALLVYRLD